MIIKLNWSEFNRFLTYLEWTLKTDQNPVFSQCSPLTDLQPRPSINFHKSFTVSTSHDPLIKHAKCCHCFMVFDIMTCSPVAVSVLNSIQTNWGGGTDGSRHKQRDSCPPSLSSSDINISPWRCPKMLQSASATADVEVRCLLELR